MARPRIFISSTYFDLQSIREELERFVIAMGYEPIRHEQGHIPYGRDEAPEQYAYREVDFADVLVSIIGSRYGTNSLGSVYSISQKELKRAFDLGKQVYIFIDQAVNAEYQFYLRNKHVPGVEFSAVNDVRIYSFIEEIYALPRGNPIFTFRTGADLVELLREQWSGLFQRLLTAEKDKPQAALVDQLQQGLQTIDELVKYLQSTNASNTSSLEEIILSNHPIFARLRAITANRYRVYFANLFELNEWMTNARFYTKLPDETEENNYMWVRELTLPPRKGKEVGHTVYSTLFVAKKLFDADGRLRLIPQIDWDDAWATLQRSEAKPDYFPVDDDEIPF